MNQDHAVALTGGVSATAMLATALQGHLGLAEGVASADAGLIVLVLGYALHLAQSMGTGRPPRYVPPMPAPQMSVPRASGADKPSPIPEIEALRVADPALDIPVKPKAKTAAT